MHDLKRLARDIDALVGVVQGVADLHRDLHRMRPASAEAGIAHHLAQGDAVHVLAGDEKLPSDSAPTSWTPAMRGCVNRRPPADRRGRCARHRGAATGSSRTRTASGETAPGPVASRRWGGPGSARPNSAKGRSCRLGTEVRHQKLMLAEWTAKVKPPCSHVAAEG